MTSHTCHKCGQFFNRDTLDKCPNCGTFVSDRDFWEKPDPYYEKLRRRDVLFFRSLKPENKKKLSEACSLTIDFLRQKLKLKKWESYFVVKMLFEEFPLDELIKEVD